MRGSSLGSIRGLFAFFDQLGLDRLFFVSIALIKRRLFLACGRLVEIVERAGRLMTSRLRLAMRRRVRFALGLTMPRRRSCFARRRRFACRRGLRSSRRGAGSLAGSSLGAKPSCPATDDQSAAGFGAIGFLAVGGADARGGAGGGDFFSSAAGSSGRGSAPNDDASTFQ